jgi:predicted RecA/RadA family phage recombinase
MAKDGKHVIHAGGVFPNPLLNREGAAAAATMPGTIGFFDAGKFTASADGSEQAILYIADFDYLRCKTVDDAIPTGELVVGIHPLPGMFLNVRAAAGTYKKGQPLAIADGQATAVTEGAADRAYCEEDKAITAAAGDLIRVVIK